MKLSQKVFQNEQIAHELNEDLATGIEGISPDQLPPDMRLSLYCECADEDCHERIELSYGDYQAIHKDPLQFMVKPDHYFPRFEQIKKRNRNYWIIRKIEERLDAAADQE